MNIHNHLSQTISSPFFPHTSHTFPCEAQVPLNSPPLRNINLTDINIKNKEINPIVISSVIISYCNLPSATCPITWFPSWARILTIMSCSKVFSTFRIIFLNPHYFTFGRCSTKPKIHLNNLTLVVLNIYL